ncbi:uncharacterized protein LOC124374565 [Homalodisca vitripennis]|uniref:uncharacterized protein LOC124374565 n=1 Tax=Homalodisca vitripennis TaxID=197043 RepID=UPI001EEBA14A|nr:uncharacterized protein LOC124374565 [Homalodisca vitripennis]
MRWCRPPSGFGPTTPNLGLAVSPRGALQEVLLVDGETSVVTNGDSKKLTSAAYTDSKQDFTCGSGAKCILLKNCKLVRQLMNKNCLANNRLREITCGYSGDETSGLLSNICHQQS